MLSLPASVRIYLSAEPTDMRKGFDGMSALVTASGLDVFSGHMFVFVSRRGDRAKVLTWQRGGFVPDCWQSGTAALTLRVRLPVQTTGARQVPPADDRARRNTRCP